MPETSFLIVQVNFFDNSKLLRGVRTRFISLFSVGVTTINIKRGSYDLWQIIAIESYRD
jgi:hypothetical protein